MTELDVDVSAASIVELFEWDGHLHKCGHHKVRRGPNLG